MAGNDKYKCPCATLHQIAQNKWKIFHEQKNNAARKEQIDFDHYSKVHYRYDNQEPPKTKQHHTKKQQKRKDPKKEYFSK